MSPTLQNTRAQRNAALARSSSSTGRVSPLVALSGHRLVQCKCLLLTQSGHRPLAHSSALAMVRRCWVLSADVYAPSGNTVAQKVCAKIAPSDAGVATIKP